MPNRKFIIDSLRNEDCHLTMRKIPPAFVDLIVTSPPYNTGSNYNDDYHKEVGSIRTLGSKYGAYHDNMPNDEYLRWLTNVILCMDRILKKDGAILLNMSYSTRNTSTMWLLLSRIIEGTPFTIADCIIWRKPHCFPNVMNHNRLTRINEFVFIICRKYELSTFYCNKVRHYTIASNGSKRYKGIFNEIHADNNDGSCPYNKATFSTELVKKLLCIYAKDKAIVYDPFMGTGTTAVACIEYGASFIGSEIDRKQVEYSIKRIEKCHRKK